MYMCVSVCVCVYCYNILSFFLTYVHESVCVCVFCNLISVGNCWQSAPLELILLNLLGVSRNNSEHT